MGRVVEQTLPCLVLWVEARRDEVEVCSLEEALTEGFADHSGGPERGCVCRCISCPKLPSSTPLEWEFLPSLSSPFAGLVPRR